MKKMIVTLLVLLIVSVKSITPANSSISNLQSGSISLNNDNTANIQTYSVSFNQIFSTQPSLAIAINSFQIALTAENTSNSFDILPQNISLTGINFVWIRNMQKWAKIVINYFISSRSEIMMGCQQYYFSNSQLVQNQIVHNFAKTIPNTNTSIARVFLIGFTTNNSQFIEISIMPSTLKEKSLSISLSVGQNLTFNSISYSWIIFSPNSSPFTSYGGMIIKSNFMGQSFLDIRKTIYQTDNIIYGFSSLKIQSKSLIVDANIDQDLVFSFKSSSFIKSITLFYIVIGITPKLICNSNLADIYLMGNYCLSQCPLNTYVHSYFNNGFSCNTCSEKLNLVLSSDKCICNNFSKLINGTCIRQELITNSSSQAQNLQKNNQNTNQISNISDLVALVQKLEKQVNDKLSSIQNPNSQQIYESSKPILSNTFPQTNSQKSISNSLSPISPPLYIPLLTNNIQTQPITINNQQNNSQIIKQSPLIVPERLIDNPPSSILPVTSQQLNLPLPVSEQHAFIPTETVCSLQNTYLMNGICICRPGFKNYSGVCQPLSTDVSDTIAINIELANSQPYIQNKPLTTQYYSAPNSNPQIPTQCRYNQIFNGVECVCQINYIRVNGICTLYQPNNQVTLPKQKIESNVTCLDGSYLNSNGECICPNNQVYDHGKCKTVERHDKINRTCGNHSTYNESTKNCTCDEGFGYRNQTQSCQICSEKSYIENGYCQQCPNNLVYSKQENECVCPLKMVLNDQKICIPKCGIFEEFNVNKNICTCLSGYAKINNTCIICSSNQIFDQQKEACLPCADNQIVNDGKCVCQQGFKRTNGICSNRTYINPVQNPTNQNDTSKKFNNTNNESKSNPTTLTKPKIKCGNGLVQIGEQCDDSNIVDGDGCSANCRVESNYKCIREPSVCTKKQAVTISIQKSAAGTTNQTNNATKPKQQSNNSTTNGLELSGNVSINSNQLFITLNTVDSFNFPDEATMNKFIVTKFTGCPAPTVYCSQQTSKLNLFDCLMIFPSGVPNKSFTIDFSYNYNKLSAKLSLPVDPISLFQSNSRKVNSQATKNIRIRDAN